MGISCVTISFYRPATVATAKVKRAFACIQPIKTHESVLPISQLTLGGGIPMCLHPSPWLDTTGLCSAEGHRELVLGPVAFGEVRSGSGKYRLFQQRDDGFAFTCCLGRRYGAFSGSREPSPDGSLAQRPQKWQDRRIIPDKTSGSIKDFLVRFEAANLIDLRELERLK